MMHSTGISHRRIHTGSEAPEPRVETAGDEVYADLCVGL